MKNYYTFNEFKNLNEGLFDIIGKGFKMLFDKSKEWANKYKGVKEVNVIFDKHLKDVAADLKKVSGIDIVLVHPDKPQDTTKPATAPAKPGEQPVKQNASYNYSGYKSINEELIQSQGDDDSDEGGDAKDVAGLDISKYEPMVGVIKKRIDIMEKEMTGVLTKMGGAEKNPELATYIGIEKLKFQLAFKEGIVKMGEQSTDPKVKAFCDKLSKDVQTEQKTITDKLDTKNAQSIKVGDQTFIIGKCYRKKASHIDGAKYTPVKIIKEADQTKEKGKVIGAFTVGDTKEQSFTAKDLESKFVPKVGDSYKYYSDSRAKKDPKNAVITVKVLEIDEKNQTAKLKIGEGKEFIKGYGRLLDQVKEKK